MDRMSSPFCIVVGDTGGEDMPKEILYVYIFNSVEPNAFGLYLLGFLPPPLRLLAQSGRPPARWGFFLCSLFPCFPPS